MVVKHTLAVKYIVPHSVKAMVVRHISQGYTEANILVQYQRNLICQAYITSELCFCQLKSSICKVACMVNITFWLIVTIPWQVVVNLPETPPPWWQLCKSIVTVPIFNCTATFHKVSACKCICIYLRLICNKVNKVHIP